MARLDGVEGRHTNVRQQRLLLGALRVWGGLVARELWDRLVLFRRVSRRTCVVVLLIELSPADWFETYAARSLLVVALLVARSLP